MFWIDFIQAVLAVNKGRVSKIFSEANNVASLGDFAEYVKGKEGEVSFASDFEFYSRPDGILGLQVHYGFAFKPDFITTVLPGLTFEYLAEGRSVAAMVFGTDPAVVKHGWVVLQGGCHRIPS